VPPSSIATISSDIRCAILSGTLGFSILCVDRRAKLTQERRPILTYINQEHYSALEWLISLMTGAKFNADLASKWVIVGRRPTVYDGKVTPVSYDECPQEASGQEEKKAV